MNFYSKLSKNKHKLKDMPKYIITGSQGFLGSWIIKRLLKKNCQIMGLDLTKKPSNLQQICSKDELERIELKTMNITDFKSLHNLFQEFQPTHILHLAGIQVPTCKKNPPFGALINVVGTANVFEAAKLQSSIKSLVYASSAAVCGPPEDYSQLEVLDDDFHIPRTIYGVYKQSTEGMARIFWQDHSIPSAGFRPLVCYGVGREDGISSDPTKAIKSAVLGRSFKLAFKGSTVFNFAKDIADIFIQTCTAVEKQPNSYRCNIAHYPGTVEEFVEIIHKLIPGSKNRISISPNAFTLPFPAGFNQENLNQLLPSNIPETSLEDGIQQTINLFLKLNEENRLHTNDLPC